MPLPRKKLRSLTDFCLHSQSGAEGLPEYFRLLGDWVGCEHGAFFQAEPGGRLCGAYHEDAAHAGQAADFIRLSRESSREGTGLPELQDLFQPAMPVQLLSFESSRARESRLYREIISGIGGWQILRVAVMEGGRPLGLIALVRGRGRCGFQRNETMALAEAAAPLAQLLSGQPAALPERQLMAEGVLLLADDGRILQSCAEGIRLWSLAQHQFFLPLLKGEDLLQSLLPADTGMTITRHLNNNWGQFEFRANRLQAASEQAGLVHVRLRHWGLAAVLHMRRMEAMQLSSSQKRVCLALLQNKSQALIADELGISLQTAISHIRQVYNRAGVSTRQDLLPLFRAGHAHAVM